MFGQKPKNSPAQESSLYSSFSSSTYRCCTVYSNSERVTFAMLVSLTLLLSPLVMLGLVSNSFEAVLRHEQGHAPVAGAGIEVLKNSPKF